MAKPPSLDDVRAIPYFDALDDAAALRLAAEWSARSYGPRAFIFRAGDDPRGFYFVRRGRVRILRMGRDGREQTLRLAMAGDTFGEVPVLDHQPAPATVETLEPAEIVFIPAESFVRSIREQPEVALRVLLHFAHRIRSFTELVEQISLQTVQARLARYLYQVAREEGRPGAEGGVVIRRPITQQDMASIVGSVREVVSRNLRQLQEDGVLSVTRKEIIVHDMAALRELA